MIYIVICAEVEFQGNHKRITIDRLKMELVEAETVREMRTRANVIYESWCAANYKNFPHTWHYIRGEF